MRKDPAVGTISHYKELVSSSSFPRRRIGLVMIVDIPWYVPYGLGTSEGKMRQARLRTVMETLFWGYGRCEPA